MEEKIKKEPNENFSEMQSSKKIKLEKEEQEQNFLFVYEKMPKAKTKMEVARKEVKGSKHKTTFSDHQCGICQKYFKRKASLNNHIECHFKPSSFECRKCKKIFAYKGYLTNHKCSTDLTCEVCKKLLRNFRSLQYHLSNVHNIESSSGQTFTCDHCGKVFRDKVSIRSHILSHAIHKVKCEICHQMLKPSSLSNHMNLVHSVEQKTLNCKICFKIFRNGKQLNVHLKSHDKKFQCSSCDQKFSTRSHLNFHMKFHENPEEFKCKICGHQSKARRDLGIHLRTHDKERQKDFKCDRCDYKTDWKGNLKVHLERHLKLQ